MTHIDHKVHLGQNHLHPLQSHVMLADQCVSFVLETRKASTSSLQRKFSLGYNRAARIIDQMEASSKPRDAGSSSNGVKISSI
jgi:DNA segregation ATPase FtsK/SpoIIIE-like protein